MEKADLVVEQAGGGSRLRRSVGASSCGKLVAVGLHTTQPSVRPSVQCTMPRMRLRRLL